MSAGSIMKSESITSALDGADAANSPPAPADTAASPPQATSSDVAITATAIVENLIDERITISFWVD
jgi:hypothetical protein